MGLPLQPRNVYIPGVQNAAGTGCPGLVLTGPAAKASRSPEPPAPPPPITDAALPPSPSAEPSPRATSSTGGGGGTVVAGDTGTGNYHGLVTTVQHRLSSSFSLLANHTWSKCLNEEDAQGDLAGTTIENPS